MKALLMAVILAGFLSFWSFLVFRSDMAEHSELRGEAVAINYVMFRESVFDYVFSLNTVAPGSITPDNPALNLPQGWNALRDWKVLLQKEDDGQLYCYIYGPAAPEEIRAAQKLMNHSRAIGWNDGGFFSVTGWPLPGAVGGGDIVSLIRIDEK